MTPVDILAELAVAANGTLPSVDARVSALQARAVMVTGTGWVLDPLPFLSYLKGVLGVFCGSCWLCQVLFFLFSVSWYVWAEDLPYLACSQMLRVYQSLQVWNLDVHTANTVYIMYAICICDHMRVFVPGAPQALVEPARRGWTPVCCFFFFHQQL